MLMCAARELAPRRGSVPALALGENLHPVAKRLIRIMDAELARVPRLPLWGAVVVTLVGLAVLPGLHSHPAVRLDNIMPRVVHGAARTVPQLEVDPEVRTLGLTALTKMLRDERRADRAKAIPALAAMGPEAEAAVPALEAFLASTHPERWKALEGFMGIYSARDPLALGYVMKGVDDKDPEVRQRSIEMLALFPHFAMEISGKLFGLLNAPDPEARFRAAAVLWRFDRSNADRIVDTVRLEMLRRVPTEREHETIEILAEMGANGRSALPALREVAEDAGRTESVRAAAKRSLERIEKAVGLR